MDEMRFTIARRLFSDIGNNAWRSSRGNQEAPGQDNSLLRLDQF